MQAEPRATFLAVHSVTLSFGGIHALQDVSLEVSPGEIVSLIGPNGAGKTSLVNCISGFYHPQRGRIVFQGDDVTRWPPHRIATLGVGRAFQNVELFGRLSVLENLTLGRHRHLGYSLLQALGYYGRAQRDEVTARRRVEDVIDFMELEPYRHQPVASLPYGVQKRVEMARALALEPRLLLLDEPMAGMTVEEKEDMARFILDANAEWGISVLLIEHDLAVVMDLSQRVFVLNFGRLIAAGSAAEVAADAHVVEAYLGEEAVAP
ncbi:ABC transporter ATP-binding protein [Limnochorda pilosa]|uniref:ABC transporter n=1 Tax=Limnochorda pilosa TaxID=1555112 RepID=A0A0K2SJA5_LIMPI|nr:ABC transporter ATP-binding protein [Limnochorda pilosa]BAS26934.1 ABC transporter [Limnochorda pilosa]